MMRNTLLLALMIIGFTGSASAQLSISTYIESTGASIKGGTMAAFTTKENIEIGVFYQRHTNPDSPFSKKEKLPRTIEQEFYGLQFAYPLMQEVLFDVHLTTRIGAANQENFVITPGVKLYFTPINRLSIMTGIGVRGFSPTGLFGLKINL